MFFYMQYLMKGMPIYSSKIPGSENRDDYVRECSAMVDAVYVMIARYEGYTSHMNQSIALHMSVYVCYSCLGVQHPV